MILNKEEYLPLSECSKKYDIKPSKLQNWIRRKYISHIYANGVYYIMTSSLTNMTVIEGNLKILLAEEELMKKKLKQSESILTEMVSFSLPPINGDVVKDAFYAFLDSMQVLLGPGGIILSSLATGKSLTQLSFENGQNLEELAASLKIAISRLRLYRMEIPNIRKRLTAALVTNQSLKFENKVMREKLEALITTDKVAITDTDTSLLHNNEHLWELLSTELANCPLTIRTINATLKGDLTTLFDFIVANKACGKSGLLSKLKSFGTQSYNEVECLLIKFQLITVLPSGEWSSPADCMIDKSNPIYLKYQNTHSNKTKVSEHRLYRKKTFKVSSEPTIMKTTLVKETI